MAATKLILQDRMTATKLILQDIRICGFSAFILRLEGGKRCLPSSAFGLSIIYP